MKQITSSLIRRLLLLLITVMGMGTQIFGQTEEQVFFYDLTAQYKENAGTFFENALTRLNIPLVRNAKTDWSFKTVYHKVSEASTYTFPNPLTFNGSVSTSGEKYFAIKYNVTNGKYKLSLRATKTGDYPDYIKFFIANGDPQTATKTPVSNEFTPRVGSQQELAELYHSDEFTITDAEGGKDYYFGISIQTTGSGLEFQFADIKLVKIIDEVIPENEYMITWADPIPNGSLEVVYSTEPAKTVENGDMVPEGTELKIIPHADENYELSALSYTISGKEAVSFNIGEEPYTFIAKDGVEDPRAGYFAIINVTFSEKQSPTSTYKPVVVASGFNTDVIAEAKPSAEHTTGTLDTQGWVLFTSDIQENGALPLDLTTVDNIPYKMADVTSNNAAVLKGQNTESTLIFKYPAKAEEVRLLSISAEGASTMEVTVNYDDDTNQTQSFIIADWWNSDGGQGEAYYGLDRIITEYKSPYSKDQIDGRKQFRLFEQVVTTNPEKTIVSVKVVNRSTGTKTPSVLGVTVLGELLEDEPETFTLTKTVTPEEGGSISVKVNNQEAGETVKYGDVITVTVTENEGYTLKSLEVDGATPVSDQEKQYTVTGNVTITATFELTAYTLSIGITPENSGTVTAKIGDQDAGTSANHGDVITLKATPKAGYMFDKWTKKGTEEVVSYRNTFDLTITEDTELVANFIEEGYPLMTRYFITNLSQQNRYFGEVGYNVGEEEIKQLFKCETEEDLPFTAYPELHKQQREGAVIDKTENKIEIVEGTTEFNMLFKQYTKNITYNDVVCEPELEWTQQAIYIDWNNDMKFEGTEIYDRVSGSKLAEENGMTRKIEVPSGIKTGTYRMRVVQMQFDDNNNISHTNLFTENFGEIRLGMAYDFEIVVTPVPNTYSITTATGIKGGKVTLKVDGEEITGKIEEGKTVTVEVTPDKYYELTTLTYKVGEDGEEQDIKETMSFKVTGETVVNATFSKLSYTVTFQQPQNGTIKVMNDKTEIQSGDKIEGGTKLTIVDTPEENYVLTELMAGETDILKDKSFIVENDTEIKAVFALTEHTFTYTLNGASWIADITIKDGNGKVINNGDKVKFGSKYTIRAEKKNKYNAVNIKVNDEQVIADVNGLVYTYTGTVNGDTHVTIDLFSNIEDIDAENVYYDTTAQILYTGGAKTVKVYDLNGRLVLNAENQETISLAELEDGIYTAIVDGIVIKLKR